MTTLWFGVAALAAVGALGGVGPLDAHASSSTDYPMMGYNSTHSGVTPDTTVSASNWDAFTLQHTVSLGGFILSSPAVAYNSTLNENVAYVVTSGAPSVAAVDTATGTILWQEALPADAYSSPTVFDNTVYFGSEDFDLYAYNATTGAQVCTFNTGGRIEASPLVVDMPGVGATVFVGDTGKSESHNFGHEWALYGVGNTAGEPACSQAWMFDSWNNTNKGVDGGSWSSPALGTDTMGRQLLVFGSNQPDDSVYALNALTGVEVWRFQTVSASDSDVGAAPTISLPGVNGITDGAVYVMGKDQHEYALDFTTGALYWDFDLSSVNCSTDPVSGTALVNDMVIFNFCKWVYAVSATATGAGTTTEIWRSAATSHSRASPIVSGDSGNQVVLRPDKGGDEDAFKLSDGSELTPFNIGSTTTEITATTAVSDGEVFLAGGDGNLYILGLGGSTTPVVTGVSPNSGPPGGGTSVTISGLNLASATSVTFGGAPAAITSDTAAQIVAISPGGTGTLDVRVTTGSGTSAVNSADEFTYTTGGTAPVVKTLTPTSGPTAGGTVVTLTGSNLANATEVTFGGKPGTIQTDTSTQITVSSPPGKAGSVSLVVHSAGGISGKNHKFTYV